MVVRDRSFPNGSPVCDYWLTRCEGFTVRAGGRNLGVVERLGFAAVGARVDTLVVRKRHRRSRALESGQVLAVVPARRLLLARRRHRRSVPNARPAVNALARGVRRTAILVARFVVFATPIVAAAVKATAALAARTAVRLVRAARDEIRDYKRKRDLERNDQRERGEEQRKRLPERTLDAFRTGRLEAPRAQLEQRLAEHARRLRRLEELPRGLPRRREQLTAWAVASRANQMRSAKLEHAHTVANEYMFALGDDRRDVGGEEQPPPAVEQA
jgi:hypothetical protein